MFAEYDDFDALGLAQLVRDKQVSSSELVETCIDRIERVNPQLNAVIDKLYEHARAAARTSSTQQNKSFGGVPFLLKDLLQMMAGVPTRSGSRLCKDLVPDFDTELYLRYSRSGLITVGKTNTPEFGLTPVTEPELFGPTCTPWDVTRTSGGSSGGSAAAVAAGIVPMAHGGDGGGSIRIPAACCGVFGLKPTRGRNPAGPLASERWNGMVVEHVLSRSVRDSAAALDATAGPELTSPYYAPPQESSFLEAVGAAPKRLRIGFTSASAFPSDIHPDCVAAVQDVAKLCEELGHDVEEAQPGWQPFKNARALLIAVTSNAAAEISFAESALGRRATFRNLEPMTWLTARLGHHFSGCEAMSALQQLQSEARRLINQLGHYDVLLTPTSARPPVKHGELQPKGLEKIAIDVARRIGIPRFAKRFVMRESFLSQTFQFVPFTPIANITGQPSMNVPLFWNVEGLPIGTMFTGRFGEDATLFQLAAELEEARPWADRRPPVHANGSSEVGGRDNSPTQ